MEYVMKVEGMMCPKCEALLSPAQHWIRQR